MYHNLMIFPDLIEFHDFEGRHQELAITPYVQWIHNLK